MKLRLGMALLAVAAVAPTACASAPNPSITTSAPAPTTPVDRDARIHELEAAVANEKEALRVLISAGPTEGDDPLLTSDEIREIATRLPALQDELRGLVRAREIEATREKRARELLHDPQDP